MKLLKATAYQCDYCKEIHLALDDCIECEENCHIKKYECDSVDVTALGEVMSRLDCSISERELEGIAENLIKYHSKINDEKADPYVGDILKLKEYLNKFKRWKKENNIE